ncbi:MAG: hypothetical protein CMC55_08780 [Flavobacteriaceae bacterium]|nr:hypothetical protein [Flavobacteriaceae bacterium]
MNHQYKELIRINDTPYSLGPFGYACYLHPRKETWEVSGSISNQKLMEIYLERVKTNEFRDISSST